MAKKKTPSDAAAERRTATAPRRRTTAATQGQPRQANDARRDPTADEIAEAAYHRYLSRQAGQGTGSDFDDWLEAERELRERRKR